MKKRIFVILLLGALLSAPSVNVHARSFDKDVGAKYGKSEKNVNLNAEKMILTRDMPAAEITLLNSCSAELVITATPAHESLGLYVPVITRLEVPKVANAYNHMTLAERRSRFIKYKEALFHLPDKV